MNRPSVLTTRRALLGFAAVGRLAAAEDLPNFIDRLARSVGGEIGFAMEHIETGERVSVRGDERFAMASVYKLPIAIEALDRVDRGTLSLAHTIRLTPADLRLGLGNNEVDRLVGDIGHDFTVRELVERMLVDSDNASSDALLALVGAEAVTARMAALGCPGIRVDRQEAALLFDYIGVSSAPPASGWTLGLMRERYRSATPEQRKRAQRAFLRDPRDTATPNAMADLLVRVHRNEVLQSDSGRLLLDLLGRCKTGGRRLRGALPADVEFRHRTGTSDTTDGATAATNDVGILTLPNGAGHVAVAAFLRMARGGMGEREAALAQIGKAVFERYAGA